MTQRAEQSISSEGRRYDIDAIRVLAFGLLIFYHIGMFYVLEWGWHIKSQYQYPWLQEIMGFFNQWRMALLFVVSGVATAIILTKSQTSFLSRRLKKLGVPLIFGMLVVVVPQAYFEARANGAFSGNFMQFWWAYLSLQDWPKEAFAGSDPGYTWNHLWYLPYIMFYTVVVVGLRKIAHLLSVDIADSISRVNLWFWIAALILLLMFSGYFIFPLFPYRSHALLDDWYTHSLFFSFFVFGYGLMRSTSIWEQLKNNSYRLLILAVVAFIGFKSMNSLMTEDSGTLMQAFQLFFIYANRVMWIVTILAFAYRYLNKPTRWTAYGNSAVFSWYILHQTIIIVLGAWLTPWALGGPLEFTLVLCSTLLACFAIHHYLIRPITWLHPLFGVTTKQQQPQKQHEDYVIASHQS